MCSGSSTSVTKASVNAPSNQPHHPSYVNAACAGSDISAACHPPSLYDRRVFDFNPNIHGWKRPRGCPTTRWADSIKHDLHSVGLDTINAAQMVFDRPPVEVLCLRTANARTRARLLKRGCIEFKYYADTIHSGLTPPGYQ